MPRRKMLEEHGSAVVDERLATLSSLRERIRKAAAVDAGKPEVGHIADATLERPLLANVLQAHLLEGGPEEGATIIIWGDPDGLGGMLNVKPLGVKGFFTAGSFLEALDCMEAMLADPDFKWKRDKPQKPRRNKSRPFGKGGY